MLSGQLPIGAIVGPQGIKGQFKVKPFTATPHSLSAYGPVTTDNGLQLTLQVMSINSKGLAITRAKGICSREAAEALRGMTLLVARDKLPDLDDGEFYHADLIGMTVNNQDGIWIGSLVSIHNFGAGDIAELAPDRGPTIMVPFGGDRLIGINMEAKELCLLVPDGLLGDAKEDDKISGDDELS